MAAAAKLAVDLKDPRQRRALRAFLDALDGEEKPAPGPVDQVTAADAERVLALNGFRRKKD